jgi:hypothetical protein
MAYSFHLGAMVVLLGVLLSRRIWSFSRRFRDKSLSPLIFLMSTSLCLIELALWPLSIQRPMLWYCLEIVTVTSRCAAAVEAFRRGWDAWIAAGAVMLAGSGVLLALCRPMQANLWFPTLMRFRGLLWLALAVGLAVVTAHQWTLLARPGCRWRWHSALLAIYFAEHAAFAFHLGPWFRAVEVHEWLSAGIYLGFAVAWGWPLRKSRQVDGEQGKNYNRNHADSFKRLRIATSR